MLVEAAVSALLVLGGAFALIGSLGLLKLPDVFMRLHGPTKATTLGLGGMLVASTIFFTNLTGQLSLHEVLVTFFLFMTAPVSAHLLAKAALALRLEHRSQGALPEALVGPPTAVEDPEREPESASS
jgi:multicomponent K+:H+ antiporter subunit G